MYVYTYIYIYKHIRVCVYNHRYELLSLILKNVSLKNLVVCNYQDATNSVVCGIHTLVSMKPRRFERSITSGDILLLKQKSSIYIKLGNGGGENPGLLLN